MRLSKQKQHCRAFYFREPLNRVFRQALINKPTPCSFWIGEVGGAVGMRYTEMRDVQGHKNMVRGIHATACHGVIAEKKFCKFTVFICNIGSISLTFIPDSA